MRVDGSTAAAAAATAGCVGDRISLMVTQDGIFVMPPSSRQPPLSQHLNTKRN